MRCACECAQLAAAAVHPPVLLPLTVSTLLQNWEDEDIPALLTSIEEELRGRIQVRCVPFV